MSAAAITTWNFTGFANENKNTRPEILHTKLCDVLSIQYPILQAGMGGMTSPELVARVSEAGGLGILGGVLKPPDELRELIKKIKQLTRKPFGVNLLLHEDLMLPRDLSSIPEEEIKKIQTVLNQYRRQMGVAESFGRPKPIPDTVRASLKVILEEKVPVFSIGLGNPPSDWIKECHNNGIKVIAMIATVEDAKILAEKEVDVIIAQGSEAGGIEAPGKKENRERPPRSAPLH